MASNTLLTPTQITRKGLSVLHNNLVFTKGVNRQYSQEFGKVGAKIGSTINVRKPVQYYIRDAAAASVQNTTETYVPLTLNHQWGVDIAFSSAELTLSLDDFSDRILTPAMSKIASVIDQTGMAMYKNIFNCVGTAGTTPGTPGGSATGLFQYNAPICYLNAGMMLDNSSCPRDNRRSVVLNPAAMAQSNAGLSGLYNNTQLVGEQYRNGLLGEALGFTFAMDQNVNAMSVPTSLAGSVTATITDGSASVTLASLTSASGTIKAGTVFTVATVYGINPENQTSTGQLQQFVVTADATISSNAATVTVSPTPVVIGATVANGTVSNTATAQAVTFATGTAVGSYAQNLAYHADAFTLGTADLEIPQGVDFAARESYDGISMRIVRAYDVSSDNFICRIDVLGGWATLRPELACRIVG
jgi:hypothetical protein